MVVHEAPQVIAVHHDEKIPLLMRVISPIS